MDVVDKILSTIGDVKSILQGVYEPTPEQGLIDRPKRPIHKKKRGLVVPVDPTGIGLTQFPVFTSSVLDTHGYTTQNAFVAFVISGTTAPAQLNEVIIEGVLEGAYNSAFVELDRQAVVFRGNGDYQIPLLSNLESLATGIRFRLDMVSTEQEARTLDLNIDGVLVSGPLV